MTVLILPEPPTLDVFYVARRMRARDREEIGATSWTDEPGELVTKVMASGAFRWGVYLDGRPVAMIGATPKWPRVWTAWAFATDDWPRVVLSATRHVRSFMIPALYNAGAIRVEATAMEAHTDARKWLTRLGATPGNPLANYGKDGQTFITYSWSRKSIAAPATAVPETELSSCATSAAVSAT